MTMLRQCLLFLALLGSLQATQYHELLELRPLPSNYLLASFQFETTDERNVTSQDYDIFPRSLLKIAETAQTHDLQLRFSRGRWNQNEWGPLPRNGQDAGGTGIEVWATIESNHAEKAWTQLVNSLSGLFCASINYIDSSKTIMPRFALRAALDEYSLFYGVLPSETVCTENLTPFLKLLPCKGQAGISSLLSGHKLFDTDWSSMSVSLTHRDGHLRVAQTVDMVFDLERAIYASYNAIPGSQPAEELICADRAYTSDLTCFPTDGRQPKDWSFEQIFGKGLQQRCGLSEIDSVDLIVHHSQFARIVPHASLRAPLNSSYTLQDDTLNLQFSDSQDITTDPAPLFVQRSLTSHGSSLHGKLTMAITNHQKRDVQVAYLTTLPWFLRPYLHTMQISQTGSISRTYYMPSKDRKRPAHIEMLLNLQAQSTTEISFDIERTVLRYSEYPPDANRGFDVPAALVILGNGEYYLRTTSLLLPLPTPDFSMPYNVIILTCTVVALCFGSMFNLLTRRLIVASDAPRDVSLLARLKAIFQRKFLVHEK